MDSGLLQILFQASATLQLFS